jgi:CDP-diacylglycerol--serine O-phosphatidyltransferase
MVKVSRSIVPSFFTVGNMFLGFFSMISAYEGRYSRAAWMLFFAAFLDAMDGKIARFTNSSSRFGVEYDSLADVVSFGLAPSFLLYCLYLKDWGMTGIFLSFMPLLFGSIRLARFNTQLKSFSKSHFTGFPIPAAALTLSSFVIFSHHYFDIPVKYPKIMLILIVIVSILMVSTIRYETFPLLKFRGSWKDKIKVLSLMLVMLVLIVFPNQLLFPFTALYLLSGPVRWLIVASKGDPLNEEEVKSESKN